VFAEILFYIKIKSYHFTASKDPFYVLFKAFVWVNIKRTTVLFFHTVPFGNTVLLMENIALLAMCVTNFVLTKANDLSTRNSLNQLKHSHARTI